MKKGKLNPLLGVMLIGFFLLILSLSSSPAQAGSIQLGLHVPGPRAIITADDANASTFVRPSVHPHSRANNRKAATFSITYVGVPAAAQTAFQYSADIWAALITSSEIVNVTLTWSDLPGSTRGSNQQPTAIELQSINIRDRWRNWPVLAAAVLLLLSSGALVRRREDK